MRNAHTVLVRKCLRSVEDLDFEGMMLKWTLKNVRSAGSEWSQWQPLVQVISRISARQSISQRVILTETNPWCAKYTSDTQVRLWICLSAHVRCFLLLKLLWSYICHPCRYCVPNDFFSRPSQQMLWVIGCYSRFMGFFGPDLKRQLTWCLFSVPSTKLQKFNPKTDYTPKPLFYLTTAIPYFALWIHIVTEYWK